MPPRLEEGKRASSPMIPDGRERERDVLPLSTKLKREGGGVCVHGTTKREREGVLFYSRHPKRERERESQYF